MNWNIENIRIENPVVSAPLAGISDKAYRILAREHGCGLIHTEMVSEMGLVYGNKKTAELTDLEGEMQPVSVQLFGSDPHALGKAGRILQERGVRLIDFNMGCPAPKIVRNGEGSALMANPELASRAFGTLVESVDIPVTVKIRKGFTPDQINAVDIARRMESLGASAVTVHGRTRDQFYSGTADWDIIRQVVQAVRLPVIGNGDVFSPEAAEDMIRQTGCTAVMVARGSFGNPWLFGQIADHLAGRVVSLPSMDSRRDTAIRHLELVVRFKGETIGIKEMRKQMAWYMKGFRGAAVYRDRVNNSRTLDEMIALVREFFDRQAEE